MSKITKIDYKHHKDRYWVFVDGEYCCSIRSRTFQGMDLSIGQEITCNQIKEMENFHWKKSYGKSAWQKEKVRLDKVKNLIETIDSNILAKITGFGANSTELIKEHPEEAGKPDIEIVLKQNQLTVLLFIEVTGTETKRGNDYWIRPDKLQYCKNHPNKDIWIVLHYASPEEQFIFVKPEISKQYKYKEINIRGSLEHYVSFNDSSPEIKTKLEFENHLRSAIKKYL